MRFQVIIPPLYETEITGFVCGGEKKIGKALWRIDVYRGEYFPRVFKNGARVASIGGLPAMVQALGYEVAALSRMI